MHEFTNLQWPETPFGAGQRPFGQHADTLTACVVEWTGEPDAGPLPVAAAMVYLRVRRHGSARAIGDDTLSIGFRAAVIEDTAEIPALFALTDRALTRARRHAVILAGYRLDADLLRMSALSAVPLRGAAGVLSAWANRATKQRGVALMVDTGSEASATGADLDMPLDPVPRVDAGLPRVRRPARPAGTRPLPRRRADRSRVHGPLPLGGHVSGRREDRAGGLGRAVRPSRYQHRPRRRPYRRQGVRHGGTAGCPRRDVTGAKVGGRRPARLATPDDGHHGASHHRLRNLRESGYADDQ